MALVGAYTNDITPKGTVDLNGYILRFGKSQGVHDPLTANFFYIESKKQKALIASLDILTISSETADKLRNEISIQLKMKKEAIILAAIHTHAAVGSPYLRNVGEEDKEWLAEFESKIIEGAKRARDKAVECDLYAYEAYSSVAINRRNPMRGIDPNAPFIIAKRGSEITACIINYNCHAVCLKENNLEISADYVYYFRERLFENLGGKFPVLFLNGGSGDIDPKLRGSFNEAKLTGGNLADEITLAYKVYEGKKLKEGIRCETAKMTIPYNWQPGVDEAKENLALYTRRLREARTKEDKKIAGAFHIWAEDVLKLASENKLPKCLELSVSKLMIGEAVFIAVPLEIFSSISLKLRNHFKENLVFVISYGNGYAGYLSDKAAHYEGGYEIDDWHKYAGILPKVPYVEDIFWKSINEFSSK
ncbi:MAG TPA: hypothetical protein VHP30_11040 [Ignavibacteriales bacterium]|nr:hypothetical protein [Ignavibacteriales bacterium]